MKSYSFFVACNSKILQSDIFRFGNKIHNKNNGFKNAHYFQKIPKFGLANHTVTLLIFSMDLCCRYFIEPRYLEYWKLGSNKRFWNWEVKFQSWEDESNSINICQVWASSESLNSWVIASFDKVYDSNWNDNFDFMFLCSEAC